MKKKTVAHALAGDLATFRLLDTGEVQASYESEGYRARVEQGEVFARGRVLRPSDGRAFFDGLESAYANSSMIFVRGEE